MDVKKRLLDEMARFNITARPNIDMTFDQSSPHLAGGRAFLQPGLLKAGRFHIHRFFIIGIIMDDVMEADWEKKGSASYIRLSRIVSAIQEEKEQLALEIANEDSFDSDIMNWWIWHFQSIITTNSNINRKCLNHYFDCMLKFCADIELEQESLSSPLQNIDSLQSQWQHRINTVGCNQFFELILLANSFYPDDGLYQDLQKLMYPCAKIVRVVNELVSIPKDISDECGSLFTSTMILHGTSVDDTIEMFIEMANNCTREYDMVSDSILRKYGAGSQAEEVARFINDLRYSTCGYIDWHFQSAEEGPPKRYSRVAIVNPKEKLVKRFRITTIEGDD